MNSAFYDCLLSGLDDSAVVDRLVHGVSWTAAVLSDGRCGVAMHTLGETRPRLFDRLEGLSAREAGQAVLSWNLEEAGEGMAVINAFYNTPERAEALGCTEKSSALEGIPLSGKRLGFVGHLLHHSGLSEELALQAREYFILEREPKEGDYPDSACEYLLPGADVAVITGSAAVNKTLPRLLELCRGARIVLTGPTVPLCPSLLELGISRLNGSLILRREEMLSAIVEKRRSISAFARYWTLDREG